MVSRASTPREQAVAVSSLPPAYRRAAAALAPLAVPERSGEIVDAVAELAVAYEAVEQGLRRADRKAFAAAGQEARRSRAHLERLLDELLPPKP
jgi:hypothetical protein